MDMGFKPKLPTFKSQLYHLLDREPWANYLSILSQCHWDENRACCEE